MANVQVDGYVDRQAFERTPRFAWLHFDTRIEDFGHTPTQLRRLDRWTGTGKSVGLGVIYGIYVNK